MRKITLISAGFMCFVLRPAHSQEFENQAAKVTQKASVAIQQTKASLEANKTQTAAASSAEKVNKINNEFRCDLSLQTTHKETSEREFVGTDWGLKGVGREVDYGIAQSRAQKKCESAGYSECEFVKQAYNFGEVQMQVKVWVKGYKVVKETKLSNADIKRDMCAKVLKCEESLINAGPTITKEVWEMMNGKIKELNQRFKCS